MKYKHNLNKLWMNKKINLKEPLVGMFCCNLKSFKKTLFHIKKKKNLIVLYRGIQIA
jgi:hypothetical protein